MLSFLHKRLPRSLGYRPVSSQDQSELGAPIDGGISANDVRRKIDRNILPLMMSLYGVQYLDKATLGRAAVLGFIEDNNLSVNHGLFTPTFSTSNWLGSIIYLGYLLFAFPQNVVLQHAPVGKWISLNISIWGVVMVLQSIRLPFVGLLACRFVLGVCEGSITSGFLMITSAFYTKSEQSSRVGYWFLMNGTAQIISNLMGYGSLYFKSSQLAPWQWFTLVNGVLTFATALAFYLYFPDSISTARFLTPEEKIIAAERVCEHETSPESKAWKPEQFKEALHDPKTWLFASFSLLNNIPTSIGIQRSLIVESLGFTRLHTTLLGTLDGVIEIITIYTGVKLVERFGYSRAWVLTPLKTLELLGMSWALLGQRQVLLGIQNAQLHKQLCSQLIVLETLLDLTCGKQPYTLVGYWDMLQQLHNTAADD
ncbi:unnamed protein product [Rhizoctonia solani]|uniref:MFS general substrate transporter n=1 Tax=Rhizoctonia solani TaxID=456999 RepID=A0A8H3DQV2_9AGAM|nr:unnamed protein product [Rhizoctonia solani]